MGPEQPQFPLIVSGARAVEFQKRKTVVSGLPLLPWWRAVYCVYVCSFLNCLLCSLDPFICSLANTTRS